jgi:hypothetical protein
MACRRHPFCWEYRYPQFGLVAKNELHVPVSDPAQPTPTYIHLLSADVDHSFWTKALPHHSGDAGRRPGWARSHPLKGRSSFLAHPSAARWLPVPTVESKKRLKIRSDL